MNTLEKVIEHIGLAPILMIGFGAFIVLLLIAMATSKPEDTDHDFEQFQEHDRYRY